MAMRAFRGPPRAARWVEHMAAGKARLAAEDLAWLCGLPRELTFEASRGALRPEATAAAAPPAAESPVREGAVYASHGLPGNPFLSIDGIDPRETDLAEVRAAAFARPEVAAAELVVCGHNHIPLTTVRGEHLVVRAAAAIGWGDQRGRAERFGGYAVLTHLPPTWEVEHRTFRWRPRDPTWTWDASVAVGP